MKKRGQRCDGRVGDDQADRGQSWQVAFEQQVAKTNQAENVITGIGGLRLTAKLVVRTTIVKLSVLKTVFYVVLAPPSPRGIPGEGSDRHLLQGIGGFGPIPARIKG